MLHCDLVKKNSTTMYSLLITFFGVFVCLLLTLVGDLLCVFTETLGRAGIVYNGCQDQSGEANEDTVSPVGK